MQTGYNGCATACCLKRFFEHYIKMFLNSKNSYYFHFMFQVVSSLPSVASGLSLASQTGEDAAAAAGAAADPSGAAAAGGGGGADGDSGLELKRRSASKPISLGITPVHQVGWKARTFC